MNNKIIMGIVVLVVVVGGVFLLMNKSGNTQTQQNSTSQTQSTDQNKAPQGKNVIVIQNMAFSPANLTIKVGDKVTWSNQDSVAHTATADDNNFDTGVIDPGKSGSNTFSKAGTYTYHCSIHPSMTGKIVVE